MRDIVKRLRSINHMSVEECFLDSHMYAEAADEIERLRERVKALEEGLSYMSRVYDAETDSEDPLLPVPEGSMVFSVASARALLADGGHQ